MIEIILPYPISAPGVYRITDVKTGRFYVGSSVNVANRWRQHQARLRLGTHPNPALQAIWNADNQRLCIETIAQTDGSRAALLAAEQQALNAAGVGSRHCLNVLSVAGSHLGRRRSAETRARMSAAQRGKRASTEAKEKMRAAKLGKPLSAEHRRKLGDAARGKKLPPRERLPRPELRRFSDGEVRAIRMAKAAGASYSAIERRYDISRGALQRMLFRQTYAEVQ